MLPWRPRVLRPCDMKYVMLHLIFSLPHLLMPREGQPVAIRCCLIPEDFLVAHYQWPHNDFIWHLDLRSRIFANGVLNAFHGFLNANGCAGPHVIHPSPLPLIFTHTITNLPTPISVVSRSWGRSEVLCAECVVGIMHNESTGTIPSSRYDRL